MITRIFKRLHGVLIVHFARIKCLYFKYVLRREWIEYGGVKMIISLDGDLQELYYHARFRDWHKKEYNLLNRLIKAGDKVIDVGANYGFVTVLLSNLVGLAGKVYCFEPSQKTFPKLLRMIDINKLTNCVAYNKGCGDRNEVMPLDTTSASSGDFSIVSGNSGPASIGRGSHEMVPVVTLDSLDMDTDGIALIKIDVEGYEPQVLAGARNLIARAHPLIYIELGSDHALSSAAAAQVLTDWGYRIVYPEIRQLPDGSVDWAGSTAVDNYLWQHKLVAMKIDPAGKGLAWEDSDVAMRGLGHFALLDLSARA
jgi:FkbM family methyltransferase